MTISIRSGYGYWTTFIESISVGKGSKFTSKSAAIFDTSSSLLLGPKAQVKTLVDEIKYGRECKLSGGLYECKCQLGFNRYPTFTFYIDENSYNINPEHYLYHNDGKCTILISDSGNSYWVLGQPFFREYYTAFDTERLKVYLWKARQNFFELNNDEGFNFIQSSVLIPAGLVVSGIVYAYRRRQANAYNYQLI